MAIFDEAPGVKIGRKGKRLGACFIFVVGAVILLLASVGPYTDYLWFKEDGRQPEVFSKLYETKGILFVIFFAISLTLIYTSLSRALRISLVFLEKPATVGQVIVSRLLGVIQDHGQVITKLVSLGLAFVLSAGFSSEWNSYLLSTHAQSFHRMDPIFGLDLGYFVFVLPWQLALASFLFGLLLLVSILTAAIYLGLESIAAIGKVELGKSAGRSHLALLFGSTIIVFGFQLWLKRYQFGTLDSGQFVGAGYSAMRQLQVQGPLAILVVALGLLTASTAIWPKVWRITGYGFGACFLVYVLGIIIYPAIIQFGFVNPNKLSTESPYAAKAIQMTRFAYGLDQIEVKETTVQETPTAADIANSSGTIKNMRLWDPDVLRHSIEALQGLKPYYTFSDVDLDRYMLGGKQQMVMLSPRDIQVNGLSASAQTWVNTRLQYTHGFGITMSPVNTANYSGQPDFLIRDIPPVTPAELPISEPRIYYSDFRNSLGDSEDNYVLVDTKVNEFDYPSAENDQSNRWKGGRGIQVGAFFPRLAFSIGLGDMNLLISTNVTSETRLLMHRGILDRAKLLYPFLKFDTDPYIVVYSGRLLWILDGYTSTDQLPYSAHTGLSDGPVNYLRNPVKVVIDAYSGETDAYSIDQTEPVLLAYESIYPGLIKDKSQIPTGLDRHFRYPESLLDAQSIQLTQYHVVESQAVAFLNNEDAWDLPTERGLGGSEEAMRPYYVEMRLPEDPKDEFLLILPFTPRQKGNMSGWLAAHCDPDNYGKLRLYQYPKGSILPGPKQMEANFNQNPAIANLNTLLKNAQSEVIVGNLLVMPIGNSVMYVEPMFLESVSPGITPIPELKKVVLALKDKVVVADTYADALKELFGTQEPPSIASPAATSPTQPTVAAPLGKGIVAKSQILQLLQIANQADTALKAGDFAKYGELQKQLKAGLEKLSR